MSILYNVYIIASSTDQSLLSRFLDVLARDGWQAHAQTSDLIFPDFYVMQNDSLTATGEPDMSHFYEKTCGEVIAHLLSFPDPSYMVRWRYAKLHGLQLPVAELTDLVPKRSDAVAIIQAQAKYSPPLDWAKIVIDRYYDVGLRFYIVVKRLDPYMPYPPIVIHSSAETNSRFRMPGSAHCDAFEWGSLLDIEQWFEPDLDFLCEADLTELESGVA